MSKREEKRGSWYLLTGVIIGLIFGLVYSWVVSPVKYIDAAPNSLREDFKAQYRALVASAYMASGDLVRAKSRLGELKDTDVALTVAMQAQQALAEARPEAEIRALGLLAVALGQGPTPVVTELPAIPTPTIPLANTASPTPVLIEATDTPTVQINITSSPTARTPQPTSTPLPTRTPTTTPGAPFVLQDLTQVCDPDLIQPLLQVQTLDAAAQQVPGVEVIVSWDGNEDHFFTGLKPEMGLGYADFIMTPGLTYTLRLADGGQPVSDLTSTECETQNGERYWGSWLLIFLQP
jgi:hypothetical protein